MTRFSSHPADTGAPRSSRPEEAGLSQLIRRGAELKARIAAMNSELRDINLRLQSSALFPEGRHTAHLTGGGYTATVQRKVNVTWDQARLAEARARMGDERFFGVFTWEFKPSSAKKLAGFLDFAPEAERALILAVRTLSPGAPQVSYEAIEQQGED